MDSDDEDVPLHELIAREKAKKRKNDDEEEEEDDDEEEEEEDDEEDEEDDEDYEDVGKKPPKKVTQTEEDADESDDDSDVPIGKIMAERKKAAPPKKKAKVVEKKAPKKKPSSSSKKAAAATKKKASSKNNRESSFYETDRGKLLQHLLRRWWYVIDWPGPDAVKDPEPNFETLPGFPGVHLCTAGDRLGELVDHRDHSTCPSFQNYYTKPTSVIKDLVLRAYDNQIKQLTLHEPQSPLLKALKTDRNICSRVNEKKADAEASKAIKAYDSSSPWSES